MTQTIQDAYRIVYNDILNSGCDLLVGKYDAKNGNEKFMYGISTVMEFIAYRVSEADGDAFSDVSYDDRESYEVNFSAFNHSNCIIISDYDNEKVILKYCKKAHVTITRKYTDELLSTHYKPVKNP